MAAHDRVAQLALAADAVMDERGVHEALLAALREGRAVTLVARGSSMWPTLRDGAKVRVEPCSLGAIKVGEVVAYEHRGRLTLHRVLRVEAGRFRGAGDARWRDDGWIDPRALLGRVTVIEAPPWHLARPSRTLFALYARATYGALRRALEPYAARMQQGRR